MLALCMGALIIRLVAAAASTALPENVDIDEVDYDLLAVSLADGTGFSYPDGNPTAVRPPLYPYFVSLVYRVAGRSHMAVRLVQCIVAAFVPGIVYLIGALVFGRGCGLVSGIIACVYPPLVQYSLAMMTESLFIPLVCLVMLSALMVDDSTTWVWPAVCGLLIGVAALCRATALLFLPFFSLWWFWRVRENMRPKLATIVIVWCMAFLAVIPWATRNYRHFGAVIPVSSNGGHIFWLGLNQLPMELMNLDQADDFRRNVPEENQRTEDFFDVVAQNNLFGMGFFRFVIARKYPGAPLPETEAAAGSFFMKRALSDIAGNPGRFVMKCIKDAVRFWYVFDKWGNYLFFFTLLLPFAVAGIVFAFFDVYGRGTLLVPIAMLWANSVLFHSAARFRVPVEPIMIVLAVGFLAWLIRQRRGRLLATGAVLVWLGIDTLGHMGAARLRAAARSAASGVGMELTPVAGTANEYENTAAKDAGDR